MQLLTDSLYQHPLYSTSPILYYYYYGLLYIFTTLCSVWGTVLRQPMKSEQNPYPPEYNGRISPDSGGSACLLVWREVMVIPIWMTQLMMTSRQHHHHLMLYNVADWAVMALTILRKALMPQVPPKRVAFRDQQPVPPHSTSSQYDHTPHATKPVFQRSYTMGGSEVQSAFVQPQGNRIQRTQTVGMRM